MVPESDLLNWLTCPPISGVVAAWFFSEDATGFTLVQMGFATLVLPRRLFKKTRKQELSG